jgi:hypothetical protein
MPAFDVENIIKKNIFFLAFFAPHSKIKTKTKRRSFN